MKKDIAEIETLVESTGSVENYRAVQFKGKSFMNLLKLLFSSKYKQIFTQLACLTIHVSDRMHRPKQESANAR